MGGWKIDQPRRRRRTRLPGLAFLIVNPRTGQAYGAEHAGEARWIQYQSKTDNWSPLGVHVTMAGDGRWRARIEWPPEEPLEFIFVADGSLETQWGGGRHSSLPAAGIAAPLGGAVCVDASPKETAAWLEFEESTGQYSISPAP